MLSAFYKKHWATTAFFSLSLSHKSRDTPVQVNQLSPKFEFRSSKTPWYREVTGHLLDLAELAGEPTPYARCQASGYCFVTLANPPSLSLHLRLAPRLSLEKSHSQKLKQNYTTYFHAAMTSYFLLGLLLRNIMTAGWCIIEVLDSHFGGARFEERGYLSRFSDYSRGCRSEES